MAQLAWAANATPAEMSGRRSELATKHMTLAAAGQTPKSQSTDHFHVIGTSSQATIDLVAEQAESQMKMVKTLTKNGAGSGDEFFHGKATIFVLPKRYEYSEFAKMVEGRAVPSQWMSHWKFDGVDAYAAVVATDRNEDDAIASRLTSPLISLAVATRGPGVSPLVRRRSGRFAGPKEI